MSKHTSPHRSVALAGVVALVALSVTACGGSSTDTTAASTTTTEAASTTTAAAEPGVITVTLTDVSSTQMLLTPDPKTAPAGSVTFNVTNDGTQEHEFVVLQTDLAASDLPYDSNTDEVSEDGDGITNVGEVEGVQPGETKTLTLDLTAGHYVLLCNIKGHYRMGMRSDFDVS